MRTITDLLAPQPNTNSLPSGQPSTTTRPRNSDFTEQERDSTGYFFLRLRSVYGAEYLRHFPDEDSVRIAKREWARQIGLYDRRAIDEMFDVVKSERMRGGEAFQWLDIGAILAIKANRWECAAHKPFEQLALPDKSARERARVAGAKAIAQMKALLGGAQ